MARVTIRVDLPIGNLENTFALAQKIIDKHTALGVGSPLTGQLDMAIMASLLSSAQAARTPALQSDNEKQAWHHEALMQIGIGKGQTVHTKGTILYHVTSARDHLLTRHKGLEENLSLWGYDVAITQSAGRRNVRVTLPDSSPSGMTDLARDIINKHTTDGVGSPLAMPFVNMTEMNALYISATGLRDNAATEDQDKQAGNAQARSYCGYAPGQTVDTPSTLLWYITKVRDLLLNLHDGNEEQLSLWGYQVIVGTAKLPAAPPEGPPEE